MSGRTNARPSQGATQARLDPKILESLVHRRKVRSEQRQLEQSVVDNATEMEAPGSRLIHQVVHTADTLLNYVVDPLEATQNVRVLESVASMALTAAKRITSVNSMNPVDLGKAIRARLPSLELLGKEFLNQALVAPQASLVYGKHTQAAIVVRERRKPAARRQVNVAATLVAQRVENVQELANVMQIREDNKDSPVLVNLLCTRGRCNLFEFVINPHSFAQSAENMFHLSTLVHSGKVGVFIDDNDVPFVEAHDPSAGGQALGGAAASGDLKQALLTLDFRKFQLAIERFGIKEAIVPVRPTRMPYDHETFTGTFPSDRNEDQ